MSELVDAARDYLSRGLAVIALTGKAPNGTLHPHGLKDAIEPGSPEAGVLETYFDVATTTGIGVLTRFPYFVVDIDGKEGAEAWKAVVGERDFLPTTWVAQTGRGLHLWYADWKPRRSHKLAPLLDLKADGGYVAAPPSLHPDGGRYEWLLTPSTTDLPMEAPAKLVALLDEIEELAEQTIITRESARRTAHAPREAGKWWATFVSLQGPIKRVRDAEPGERNAVLFWAAMAILEDGARQEELEQLAEAAIASGLTGLETRRTIRSAHKRFARG